MRSYPRAEEVSRLSKFGASEHMAIDFRYFHPVCPFVMVCRPASPRSTPGFRRASRDGWKGNRGFAPPSSAAQKTCRGGPCSTTRPRSNTTTQSATRLAKIHLVGHHHHRHPLVGDPLHAGTLSTSPVIVSGSRAEVGSSNSITSRLGIASARGNAPPRCCWPPDRAGLRMPFGLVGRVRPCAAGPWQRASASLPVHGQSTNVVTFRHGPIRNVA